MACRRLQSFPTCRIRHFVGALLWGMATVVADTSPTGFSEGELTMTYSEGQEPRHTLRYQKKGDIVRIEGDPEAVPEGEFYLVNLNTGELSIVRNSNRTWIRIPPPAGAKTLGPSESVRGVQGLDGRERGLGARPTAPGTPARHTLGSTPPPDETSPSPVVPKALFPEINLPGRSAATGRINPPATGLADFDSRVETGAAGGILGGIMPGTPPRFPGPGVPGGQLPAVHETMELVAEGEQRVIHGFVCTRYYLSIPRQGRMTLWLSKEEGLPPFHLPSSGAHRRPASSMVLNWRQRWAALMREEGAFPFLAVLRNGGESAINGSIESPSPPPLREVEEIARWEVTHIETKNIEDAEGTRFTIPESFVEVPFP